MKYSPGLLRTTGSSIICRLDPAVFWESLMKIVKTVSVKCWLAWLELSNVGRANIIDDLQLYISPFDT